MNILVTSLSRKVPLLEALRGALAEGVVWGADSDPGCVGRYFADRFWEMPRLDSPGAEDEILRFCAAEAIGLLVPTRDGELAAFAALREPLGAAGTHVAVAGEGAVATCLDKLRFHEHCARHDIPTAPTHTDLDELADGPVVVKERFGAGSRSLALGLAPADARAFADGLEAPIFQPLLAGVEHSVDLYANGDGRVVDAAPRTRIRVHDGESVVTETVEHPRLVEAAVRFAESLPLNGHAVIQGFVDGDDVKLLECNPRVGGASTLGFHAGIDTPAWAIAEARGETVAPRPGGYRRGLRMVRYPADRLFAEWS